MNYFENLEDILLTSTPKNKFEKFEKFYEKFLANKLTYDFSFEPKALNEPSYKSFMKIVLPKDVKIRKYFDTKEGKASLLHTIAHIEYSAIDLALDAALRFKNMPNDYYKDWLEVASDEIRHFLMIEQIMKKIGYKYGDFEVHTNLFEAMKRTTTLVDRMAIVPRYLEANGLDQNPKIMKKLESNPDTINSEILKALNIILQEEVDHVYKGDRWFRYACEKENLNVESTYLELLEKYYPGSTQSKKPDMNFEARKKAGFSCDELKRLSNKEECF
ncbi:MAG: ferritin-like domain-containing protein [Arcobacter sp.]|uniref:ferritin-like domain-containing protein n=1 Tax=Arcobacter sp. TaxID=1872629 RepID=UPI003AFF8C2B